MKKQFNRFIALLLSLLMLLGTFPASVLAAESEESVEPVEEPVEESAEVPKPIVYFDMNEITDGKVTNQADGQQFTVEGSIQALREAAPDGTMALEFDGKTTYINIGKEYQVTDAFTAAAWVYVDSGTAERAKLFGTGRTGVEGEKNFNININRPDQKIWYDISGFGWGNTTEANVTLDAWQHIAITCSGDTMTFYINGTAVESLTGENLNIPEYSTDMLIGAGWDKEGTAPFANHMLKGSMDEVRLYNVALTEEQINELIVSVSNEKQITGFVVEGQLGVSAIDESKHTITVTVSEETDVTAVAPEITVSEKATVEPASGVPQDFTDPVTYTVTAENGTSQMYTVIFKKVAQEDDPYLKQDGTPAYGILDAVQGKLNWLETTQEMPTTAEVEGNVLTMENGAIRREFVLPEVGGTNFYTRSYENTYIGKEMMTGESNPEVYLGLYTQSYDEVYDGTTINVAPEYYYIGGDGDADHTFVYQGYTIKDGNECEKPFEWAPRSKSYSDPAASDWPPKGKHVEFTFTGPENSPYKDVTVKVIYEMYDNCAAMKKRVEVTNTGDQQIMIGRLAPEALRGNEDLEELLYFETDYTCGADGTVPINNPAPCGCGSEDDSSPFHALKDLTHSCYDIGPAYELTNGQSFVSFNTYELVHSTYWFEQQSLERLGFYRKLFPWITDNPLTLHNTGALTKEVIDHAASAGFEMVIQSYGAPDRSGQMLTRNQADLDWYKEMIEYAHSKNVDIGIYQAQYLLGQYKGGTDYGTNNIGQWGTWCLASAAFDDYWDNFKYFIEYTGVDCVEIDGPYPGCACDCDSHVNADKETDPADSDDTTTGDPSKYAFHNGYFDSKVKQWENAVRLMCKDFRDMDVYIKVPAWYYLSGGNKCGIGYEEVAWSQPRQEQLIYGRQIMHNASYVRTMSMSWSHIPFQQYHGGGSSAAFQPFGENAFDYNWVIAQNIGNGVTSDYRGTSLYDDTVLPILQRWVNFYNRYRGIVNSDMVHISQASYEDDPTRTTTMDTLYHVNANNDGEKGLLWVYNQTDEVRTETITVPVYYTGLTDLDYPSYPIPDSMGENVKDYGTWPPNYSWLPEVRDYDLPETDGTNHGTAAFVRDGVDVQILDIDSNGNVQLEVTLQPMSFTYFAIYDESEVPEVTVSVEAVTGLKAEENAATGVKLTWDANTEFTVTENGETVKNPSQSITGYKIYRDGELIGESVTNSFTDTDVSEHQTYTYTVSALVGETEGAKSSELQLEVAADNTPPQFIRAQSNTPDTLVLTFNEPMDKDNAENTAHYTLSGGKSVTKAVLSEDGRTVTLTVDALETLQEYTLTINGLTDAAQSKNPLPETTCTVVSGYLAYYSMNSVDNSTLKGENGGSDAAVTNVTATHGIGKNGSVHFYAENKAIGDLGSGIFSGLDTYSINFYVWAKDLTSEGTQAILSAGQEGYVTNDLGVYLENGTVQFRTCGGEESAAVKLTAEDKLLEDTWNQVTVTRSGNTFKLYLNGKLQAETTSEVGTFDSLNAVRLGAMTNHAGGDTTAYFNGYLDELALYSIALTPEQVQSSWTSYQGYDSKDPIISLDFEDLTEDNKVTNLADGKQYAVSGKVETDASSGNQTQGLKFDGSTYINLGNEYQLGSEFTVSAWINVATTGDNRNHKIFGRGWTTHPEGEFYVCIRNSGYNISFSNVDGGGGGNLYDYENVSYIPTNEWVHLAVTCDGSTVQVYKNGELQSSTGKAWTLNLSDNMKELLVGGGWNSTGTGMQNDHMFKGAMDEVRLYDMALTQEEIQNIMKGEEVDPTVPVTGVTLDKTELTLEEGVSAQLTATVEPENASNKNVTWTTSDDKVATVEGGKVTAVAEGTATITVTTEDGNKTASCTVTVKKAEPEEVPVTGVTLDKTELTLEEGASAQLTAVVEPENASNKNVTWTTSDDKVATVEGGKVTAVAEGTATITVTTEDGNKTASCTVTVKKGESEKVPVTGVTLDKTELTLEEGASAQLTATVEPENASNKNVTWTTSDDKVATVEGGKVTAVAEGTATITVTTEDGGFTATCAVTVEEKDDGGSTGGGSTVTRYTITVKQTEGGKISPATCRVDRGSDKTFTIKANEGYTISDVLVDGKSVGAVSSYTFENVKASHTITAEFTKDIDDGDTPLGDLPFIDVKSGDWFAEAVKYVVENKLMNGVAEDKFAPNSDTTRAMIVTILYREAGSPKVESDGKTWWSDARVWAMEQKISDGTNMEGTITREQLAAMLYRYAGSPDVTGKITGFSDTDKISDWASDAMLWAVENGILNGSSGKLNPQGNASRAEVAAMLMRFCELTK